MKQYKDMRMLEIPIQMNIEIMSNNTVFMSKVASGLYNVYIKLDENTVYFLKSYRRFNGKFETITYSSLSEVWKNSKYDDRQESYIYWIPYYKIGQQNNTYIIGFIEEKALNLWKLKTKLMTESKKKDREF